MKRNLEDISIELDGLSAIACALAIPFYEEGAVPGQAVIAKAFDAFSRYIDRLSEDIEAIESERLKANRKHPM